MSLKAHSWSIFNIGHEARNDKLERQGRVGPSPGINKNVGLQETARESSADYGRFADGAVTG
jgi:hypothetical protein